METKENAEIREKEKKNMETKIQNVKYICEPLFQRPHRILGKESTTTNSEFLAHRI